MESEISIRNVEEQPIAVIRDRIGFAELGQRIAAVYPRVYAVVADGRLPQTLHNAIVYRGGEDGVFDVEIGVQVVAPFQDVGELICSRTPAGRVAVAVHRGPYAALPDTHRALDAWCAREGHVQAGVRWEVYGDWTEDEAKLRTDVFCLLS